MRRTLTHLAALAAGVLLSARVLPEERTVASDKNVTLVL
jgi:hypothetical protein